MLMETEIWKDIPWWEWKYQVSSLGNVLSYKMNKPKLLSQFNNNKWYKVVHLYDKSICHPYQAHRLVALAFLWLTPVKYIDHKTSLCVCHKDDNPSNNRVDNLFLGTHTDNMRDMIRKWRGNQPSWKNHIFFWRRWPDVHSFWKTWKNSYAWKAIIQYSNNGSFIKEWDTMTDASNTLWVCWSNISQVCSWKKKTAWWFKWIFKI